MINFKHFFYSILSLLLMTNISYASSSFMSVNLRCESDIPGTYSRSKIFIGATDHKSLILSHSSFSSKKKKWVSHIINGYSTEDNHLDISGKGLFEDQEGNWKSSFIKTSSGNYITDLESGIDGTLSGGTLGNTKKINCRLNLISHYEIEKIDNYHEEIVKVNEELSNIKSASADANKVAEELSNHNLNLEKDIDNLKIDLENKINEINQLKNNFKEIESELKNIKLVRIDENKNVEKLINQNKNLVKDLDNLSAELKSKQSEINGLKQQITDLELELKPPPSCPQQETNISQSNENDAVITYLEEKNKDLENDLKLCRVNKEENKGTEKPRTEIIFNNVWQLSKDIKCSSETYTLYDKKLGNVSVINGEKQSFVNSPKVKIIQNSNTQITIETNILANDLFRQLNDGENFPVTIISELVELENDNTIVSKIVTKQLDTDKFMKNPENRVYNETKETTKKQLCQNTMDINIEQKSETSSEQSEIKSENSNSVPKDPVTDQSTLTTNAEIKCSIIGGEGIDAVTTQKLYYDVFKAVQRLGWSTAKNLKSCSSGNMSFSRVPMLTTNDETIVFDTQKAVIEYKQTSTSSEVLCYDMKLKKQYRKNGRCP